MTRKILAFATAVTCLSSAVGSSALQCSAYTEPSSPAYEAPLVVPSSKIDEILACACNYIGHNWESFRWVWGNSEFIDYCAIFIDAVLQECGIPSGVYYPHSPFVDNEEFNGFVNFFRNRGKFVDRSYSPYVLPGWLIAFDQNYDGFCEHIGLVFSQSDDLIVTVEANSTGGLVCMKTYNINDPRIKGYCMTDFDNNSAPLHTATTSCTTTSNTTTTTVTTTEYIASAPVTTSTATALPETTYSPLVTTFTANLNPGFKPELMKIASDIGGKFRETPDLTTEYNVKKILDTGALFNRTDTVNGFAYGFLEDTGEFGYVHLSILTSYDDTNVSSSTRPTHRVSSDVGCRARSSANFWSDTLMILDTDQLVTVLYPENGFFYCEFTLPDGSVHNAYIHNSVISPLS